MINVFKTSYNAVAGPGFDLRWAWTLTTEGGGVGNTPKIIETVEI